MDLSSEEIFFLVDSITFLVMIICLTILGVLMYVIITKKLNAVCIIEDYERQKEDFKKENAALKSFIKHHLDKSRIKNFEMFQNAIRAQEKRLKTYVDEQIKKKKDEN